MTHEIVINKSKFLSSIYDVNSKEDVEEIISKLKKEYKDATHICYAYITSNSGGMSDDGEPRGTAGKPIYNLLMLKGITNKLIVVVRYYGGTKLGSGKLIRAYVSAAKALI